MKIKRSWLVLCRAVELTVVVLLWTAWSAPAQQLQNEDAQQLQRVESPPAFGTFHFVQRKDVPPFPFDPFFGQLPVYEIRPGVYLVNDAQVDYLAWNEQKKAGMKSEGGGMSLMSGPAPCEECPTNGGGGGVLYSGPPAYSFAPTNLWLEITSVTNNQAFFVVHRPSTFGNYDLFGTTNLATNVAGLNRTNWAWLMRTSPTQTNLVLTNLWPSEGWFQLGTMLDSDSDSLPDAFEMVVSKTNPQLRDSDSDSIEDGNEMGPNGLPWRLEQNRRNAAVVYANAPAATEGGACGQFTVYLPAPAPAGGATVQYHLGGTAVSGSEFTVTPSGGSVTIAVGATSATITVCAVNDIVYADLERYAEITLTNATCCSVDTQPARVTLIDNDSPAVRVFAFPQWVRKPSPTFGTNKASFYFIRDGDSLNALTVGFTTNGTAQAGIDYNALPSSIIFPANVRTNELSVTLKPTTNATDKTLSLTITSVPGYQIDPAAGAATMTIASSTISLPTVQVTATDDDARETGTNSGTFTFTRTGSTATPLRVFYRTSGTAIVGSNNSDRDYFALKGYVDFAVGRASTNVTVTPIDDTISETVETVIVTLATGEYQVGTANTAMVYIDDNEPISYDPVVLSQGVHGANYNRPLYTKITRYGSALGAAALGWAMTYTPTPNVLQSATASGHASGSQVQWAARQSVAYVNFTPSWIGSAGQSNSTYTMALKLNGDPFQPTATYRPQGQVIRLTASAAATNILEGTTLSGALTFTRPFPSASAIAAFYSVDGSVESGTDYTALSGRVDFAANTGGSISVNITATANPQTNGWRTGVVTFNTGPGYHGDAGLDRAFFRIQDPQNSNPLLDTDMDGDGLSDGWELDHLASNDPLTPNDPHADSDRDGLGAIDEMQLGTNPSVADGQPAYPSEDPDDYMPLRFVLGAGGKLALKNSDCAVCHQVGLRVGSNVRFSPMTSSEQSANVDPIIRLLRGTNYAMGLMDHPYSKVLKTSETNTTIRTYTASYTAQVFNGTNRYTLITDTNSLFGTNRAMVQEAIPRAATLFVPDMIIAADVDRDGIVNATNRNDRTSANNPFTFWINDDSDFGSDDTADDLEPSVNPLDSANTVIGNLRDLEDTVRLHFRVEGLPGNLLTNPTWQTRVYLTNLAGTPSLRLFSAAETNGGAAYLTNEVTANAQLGRGPLGASTGLVTNGSPLVISGINWLAAGSNRFFLPAIFEGLSTGRCAVVFAIASNTGPDVAISRPFYLELRRVSDLYEHWTAGDTDTTPWNLVTARAGRTADSAVFGPPQTQDELNYILFVHGWRMKPWARRAFASTAFKRSWHAGYRGRFGFYSWPTEWTTAPVGLIVDPENYNRSERIAHLSSYALVGLLERELNQKYPQRVRVFAHSMGNVVVSEALRLRARSQRPAFVHTYIACQAAIAAHVYDPINPALNRYAIDYSSREIYAHYPPTGNNYGIGLSAAAGQVLNYHNREDFALNTWDLNQDNKPNPGYVFVDGLCWVTIPGHGVPLDYRANIYEIFAHGAEARSRALGAAVVGGFTVQGELSGAVDLNVAPFSYSSGTHDHSAQFRSTVPRRISFYRRLLSDFGL